MSAHVEGPVVCDWCRSYLLPLTNFGNDKFYHEVSSLGSNYCPHDGKFYQVDWVLGIVSEVK